MITVNTILGERSQEIEKYFDYILSCESSVEEDVFKILKANMLLMLYNVIEATISNTIEEIRIHIFNDPEADFDCLKNEIKIQIIGDLKNISPYDFVKISTEIKNDVIKFPFKKEKISNGNIDRDVISKLSKIYGFEINLSDFNKTNHGNHLYTIKGKRNDLAHGTYSFTEVGKDYSIIDLENFKKWTLNYLKFILENVKTYLDTKGYKIATAQVVLND